MAVLAGGADRPVSARQTRRSPTDRSEAWLGLRLPTSVFVLGDVGSPLRLGSVALTDALGQ